MPDCPQSLLANVEMTEYDAQLLAGNSFSMATMGQFMMYVMSKTEIDVKPLARWVRSDFGQLSQTRDLASSMEEIDEQASSSAQLPIVVSDSD